MNLSCSFSSTTYSITGQALLINFSKCNASFFAVTLVCFAGSAAEDPYPTFGG